MKKSGIVIIAAMVLALFISPFHRRDVAKLQPVQTLSLSRSGALCHLQTDGGLFGEGPDPASALQDLEASAPGELILSTTRQLVLAENARDFLEPLLALEALRPGTELYVSSQPVDPGDASSFLNSRGTGMTVSRVQALWLRGEPVRLSQLVGGEGRYEILEPQ